MTVTVNGEKIGKIREIPNTKLFFYNGFYILSYTDGSSEILKKVHQTGKSSSEVSGIKHAIEVVEDIANKRDLERNIEGYKEKIKNKKEEMECLLELLAREQKLLDEYQGI